MRFVKIPILMVVGLAALALPSIIVTKARADSVLLSNLGESQIGSVGFNDTVIAAVSFSTGQVGATLDNAVADLSSNPGTTVFAQIHSDNNNSPGALFADLGSVTFTQATEELAVFNAASPTTLAAGEKFWLVLSTNDTSGANWLVPSGVNFVSPIGWTIDSRTQSNDGGGSWLPPNTSEFVLFALNGAAAVPEPSSLVLLFSGLGLAGAVSWSRVRRADLLTLPTDCQAKA
jgi:hypothetical protein